jgi:hypothetical protein
MRTACGIGCCPACGESAASSRCGISQLPAARLETTARDLATPSRLLAAAYVFVAPTYRSRDADLQTMDSIEDGLAIVEYLRKLPSIDRQSTCVSHCMHGIENRVTEISSKEAGGPPIRVIITSPGPPRGIGMHP